MRVVKVIDDHCAKFYAEVSKWGCLAVVPDPSYVPKGEAYVKHDKGAWLVYVKSKVHLATPRYWGRYDNILSAVFKARLV
jgi:hypothetical protein